MDEGELSIWMIESEKFLPYVEVPHGYTLDQANAPHRDNALRPLLDALLSLPVTPRGSKSIVVPRRAKGNPLRILPSRSLQTYPAPYLDSSRRQIIFKSAFFKCPKQMPDFRESTKSPVTRT